MAEMSAEQREIARLTEIYRDLPPKRLALAQGLIVQAARLRVQLDILSADIAENGMTEEFRQSDKVEPYTRERPEAALFVKLDKAHQTIIKQLSEMIPPENVRSGALAEFLGDDQ